MKAALEAASITIDTHLIRSLGALFDAQFWPAIENVPYERLYVRAGTVPAVGRRGKMKRKPYASDILVGGAVGLAGFYGGYSREATICSAIVATGLSIFAQYLYRQWRVNDR